jgi:hypothetical protein
MAKWSFQIQQDEMTQYQAKIMLVFIIKYLSTKFPSLKVDDMITAIPPEIKHHFKQI